MKKLMAGSLIAMAAGAGMMAYALNNKNTKKKASSLVNNAMDMANNKIKAMKQSISLFLILPKIVRNQVVFFMNYAIFSYSSFDINSLEVNDFIFEKQIMWSDTR